MLGICLIGVPCDLSAQVYLEKQSRHRFAQLNFGIGYQSSFGGSSNYLDAFGVEQAFDLPNIHGAKLYIGGTHFWGHADIYVSFPLFSTFPEVADQDVFFTTGAETVFKYYPWRIQSNKLRPFVGVALIDFFYQQNNTLQEFGEGMEYTQTRFPLMTGFTFNKGPHLLELGLTYFYDNEKSYYISRTATTNLRTPPFFANISYRYLLDTTLSAEETWESGRSKKVTEFLAKDGKLNNFFFGVGGSSAWWWGNSTYNDENRPFIERYSTSILPEFSLGYYWHKPDLQVNLAYRSYGGGASSYGVIQDANRRSFALEAVKFLADYHGFVPFIGPAISYEDLSFAESFEGTITQDVSDQQLSYGLTFGWDIRPDRVQSFILRTNLRYWPFLELDLGDGQNVSFRNVEFNFIQLILFPGRIF